MKKENNIANSSAKKARRKRILNYSLLFVGLFGVTAATAYFLIPSKKSTLGTNGDDPTASINSDEEDTMTPAQHFTSQLMAMKGLSATVDSFTASIPNSKDTANPTTISLKDTSLQLVMNGWPDISFNLDTTVVLNNAVSKDINIFYADSNVYLSALGLKYKTTSETIDNLFDNIYDLGEAAGIGTFDLGSIDTSKASSLLNNLTSSGSAETGYVYTLPLDDAKTQIITMTSDKDYNLTGVSATGLVFNGVTLTFSATTDLNASLNTADFIPTDKDSYLDIYNSWTMIQKVADLVMKPSFGISMDIDMTKTKTESGVANTYEVAQIAGSANLNVQSSLYGGSLSLKAPNESTLASNFVSLASEKITNQSLAAAYVGTTATDGTKDGTVYASYNDALNLKMTTSVAENLIAKIKKDIPAKDLSSATTLFSFVTDSTVMKALAKGQYEAVVNMLDDFKTANNQIIATVHLKDLGLGADSKIVVTLDGNASASSLASIEVFSIEMSDYEMNAKFALTSYTAPSVTPENYQTLDKLPNIYDQFYALSQDIKAGATIKGSVMGYDSTTQKATTDGVSFDGSTEFDANQDLTVDPKGKSGTGTIDITQVKAGADYQTHHVAIDVRGVDKMLFRYTSSASNYQDYLNGKFTISTLNDIIALVQKLMKSTDARYTKFLDALTETMANTVVGEIMAKDYETLLRNKVLTKLNVYSDSIELELDKKLLGSTTNVSIVIALDTASKVKSVSLTDFAISGKLINATIALSDYDANALATLPDNVTYLDFSQIAVLMQFGITTSELNYFHITATAGVYIGSLLGVEPTLDFYISVDGATVKVVGYINDIPLIIGVNGSHYDNLLCSFGGTRNVVFYYQTGYCYIHGHDDYDGTKRDETQDIKVKDTYFVSNILHYLLADVLEASPSIQSQIDTSSSSSTALIKFEDVLKNFVYTASTTTPKWDLTLDTGVLANDSSLKDLVVTISGTDKDSTDGTLDGYLDTLNVTFSLVKVLTIKITLNAKLVNIGTDYSNFFATTWQNYITAHANDTVEGA